MTPTTLCLDSNVVAKWVFWEAQQEEAFALFDAYQRGELSLVAPDSFSVERVNIVRHKLARGVAPQHLCDQALQELFALRVRLVSASRMNRRIFEIANTINESAWDAAYIAVAETEDCDFWTADKDLARKAKPHFPFVKLLGEDTLEGDHTP